MEDRPPRARALLTCFAVVGFLANIGPLGDNSFLTHLANGRLILDRGFPHSDPYSWSAHGATWVLQSWLVEVVYGALSRSVGLLGIRLFVALVSAAISSLMFVIAMRTTRDPLRASIVTIGALAVSVPLWIERPLMVGALCFVLVVLVIETPGQFATRFGPWLLVPLFWIWGNSHGSWVLGVGYVCLRVVGNALDDRTLPPGRPRLVLLCTAIGALAVALNPYGVSLLLFPFSLSTRASTLSNIVEWQSPQFQSMLRWPFLVWAAAVAVLIGRNRGRRFGDAFVAVAFIGLGFWALRNLLLVPIATLPIVGRGLQRRSEAPVRFLLPSVADNATAIIVLLVGVLFGLSSASQPNLELRDYPVAAMRTLDANGLLGRRLVTTDLYGALVIDQYWPRQKVFFDDRYDMYPKAVADDYFALRAGAPEWRSILEARNAEAVMWPAEEPLAQLLAQDPQWRQVPSGQRGVALFVRKDV